MHSILHVVSMLILHVLLVGGYFRDCQVAHEDNEMGTP